MTQRPLHIALFSPAMNDGGAERVLVLLAEEFIKRGHKIDLLLFVKEGPFLKTLPKEVNIIELGRTCPAFFRLILYLMRNKPDVLMPVTLGPNALAILANLISNRKTKIIATAHGMISAYRKTSNTLKWKVLLFLWQSTLRFADGAIAVSRGAAQEMKIFGSLKTEQVKIIHNPIHGKMLEELAHTSITHPFFDRRNRPVILWVGRLTEPKDPATLIRGFSLSLSHQAKYLLMLGEGKQRPDLEKLIQELGIEENVDLPGFFDNPYPYMKKADVLVLSSHYESFGNVLVEAMALGTPVIATDCPAGPREILRHGEHGILVPPSDPNALSDAITQVLKGSGPGSYDRLSAKQRASDFSCSKIADLYLTYFYSLKN